MLLRQLPRESALVRSISGEKAEWTATDHLLAATVDELRAFRWVWTVSKMKKGQKRPPAPEPLPRPGYDRPADRLRFGDAKLTTAEMRVLLDKWKGGD